MSDIGDWTQDIHVGDAADTLAEMPESSVHMSMTSPPYYGLRDYGEEGQLGLEDTLEEYIDRLVAVGDALRRVLRPDGSWWLNLGDSYAGSWGAQSHDAEENHEAIDCPEKNPARAGEMQRKNKMLVPHRVAIALQQSGWVVRNDVTWHKPNPIPSSVQDRLNCTTEQVFHLTPQPDYWYDLDAVREPHAEASVERSQYGYTTAGNGSAEMPDEPRDDVSIDDDADLHPAGKNPGDVFEVTTNPYPEAHFAVYPPELCHKPIKSSCPPTVCADCGAPYEREVEEVRKEVPDSGKYWDPSSQQYRTAESVGQESRRNKRGDVPDSHGGDTGLKKNFLVDRETRGWTPTCDCDTDETRPGIVIDPFAGAGTTCMVGKDLGRRFIGIDLNPEYVAMAQKRVGVTVDDPERLLDDDATALRRFADGGEHE